MANDRVCFSNKKNRKQEKGKGTAGYVRKRMPRSAAGEDMSSRQKCSMGHSGMDSRKDLP